MAMQQDSSALILMPKPSHPQHTTTFLVKICLLVRCIDKDFMEPNFHGAPFLVSVTEQES